MRSKLIVFIVPFLILVIGLTALFIKNSMSPKKEVHYHAGFLIVKNNQKVDFSGTQYMELKPCAKDSAHAKVDEQLEKAHLHDNIGDVVHVEAANAKWKDLFTNLNYPVEFKDVTAYSNGSKINDFPNQPITAYESVVIFIGKNNNMATFFKQAVTKSHIVDAEKKSETCGS